MGKKFYSERERERERENLVLYRVQLGKKNLMRSSDKASYKKTTRRQLRESVRRLFNLFPHAEEKPKF